MSPTGPHTAHERLLEQQAFLRRLARSLVADPHRAEDLAQDATLIALELAPDEVGSLRSWLARVLRNRATNVGLSEERRRAREAAVERPAPAPAPDEVEARFAVQRRVIAAVDRLEEPYRSTIVLRYYEDQGPSAIAAQLGLPVATVKSRLARGLVRLREDLDETQPEGGRAWALVLAGGLGQVARPAAPTAVTTGGIIVGAKLALLAATVGGGIALGGWWITRSGSGSPPLLEEGAELAAVATQPGASPTEGLNELAPAPARTPLASAQPEPLTGAGGKSAPAWVLSVEVHGWIQGDTGPVTLDVFRAEDTEPALTTSAAIADEIPMEVGELFADAAARPDRLRVRIDHPAYLPLEAGVLVPQELLQPDVLTGQLHTLVELRRAKAAVTGTVEVHSDDPDARARVAILPFKFDYPFAEPLEVVEPGADGRFRLRADDAERHAVVAFDARSAFAPPESTGVTLRPVTQAVTLAPGEERDLGTLVVEEGLSIQGQVVLPSGSAAGGGSVSAGPTGQLKASPFGLAWVDGAYENAGRSTPWDDEGKFVLGGLGPRLYRVSAMPSKGDLPESCIGVRKAGESVLVVPPASDVHLTLEDTVRVTFEVRAGGQPLPGAALTIYWPDLLLEGWETVSTDDAGQRMLDFDPAGGLRVEARDARHGAKELSLTADELRASDLFVLDLDGPPVEPATLVVDVPAAYASSLEGVGLHVLLYDLERCSEKTLESARRYSRHTSGGGGIDLALLLPTGPKPTLTRKGTSWELAGIPAGEYLVRLDPVPVDREAPFLVLNEQLEVTLPPGDRVAHTWIPRTGGLVRLNFVGPRERFWAEIVGSDEAQLGLTYRRPGPGQQVWIFGSVDSLGASLVFPALPPEQYLVRIRRKGGVVDFVPFEVTAGGVHDVEVDLGGL